MFHWWGINHLNQSAPSLLHWTEITVWPNLKHICLKTCAQKKTCTKKLHLHDLDIHTHLPTQKNSFVIWSDPLFSLFVEKIHVVICWICRTHWWCCLFKNTKVNVHCPVSTGFQTDCSTVKVFLLQCWYFVKFAKLEANVKVTNCTEGKKAQFIARTMTQERSMRQYINGHF